MRSHPAAIPLYNMQDPDKCPPYELSEQITNCHCRKTSVLLKDFGFVDSYSLERSDSPTDSPPLLPLGEQMGGSRLWRLSWSQVGDLSRQQAGDLTVVLESWDRKDKALTGRSGAKGLPREDTSPFTKEEPLQRMFRVRSLGRLPTSRGKGPGREEGNSCLSAACPIPSASCRPVTH